jgi:hypothetical protein
MTVSFFEKRETTFNNRGRSVKARERKATVKALEGLSGKTARKLRDEFKRKGFLSKKEMKILNELVKPSEVRKAS